MAPPIRIDDLNEFPQLRKSMNNVILTPLNTDWIPDHVSSLAPKEETSNCSPIMLDDMNEFPPLPTGARCVRKKKILYNTTRGRTHLLPFF